MRHCIPSPINNAPDRFSTLGIALLVGATVSLNAHARVTQILIDEIKPVPTLGYAGIAYEQIAGRAFGELDPANPKTPSSTTSIWQKTPMEKCATSPPS